MNVSPENPNAEDVRALIERHLAFARAQSPPEDVHALDAPGLTAPGVEFFGLRRDGKLLAIGALQRLDAGHAEVKSMHTAEEARRMGLARAMVEHLIAVARRSGYRRLSLETGSTEGFAPARALYASVGFAVCGPFGSYIESPFSTFMTMSL